jgi:hypothetical protein
MATNSTGRLDRELRANPKAGQKGQRGEIYYYWINTSASDTPQRKKREHTARQDDNSVREGVAHALRGSGLAGLKNIQADDDLQQAVAALTGAYQMLLARHDNLMGEVTAHSETILDLRKSLDKRQPDESLFGPMPYPPPRGYAVMAADVMIRPSLDDAKAAAEDIIHETDTASVHVVAILATAELAVTWHNRH